MLQAVISSLITNFNPSVVDLVLGVNWAVWKLYNFFIIIIINSTLHLPSFQTFQTGPFLCFSPLWLRSWKCHLTSSLWASSKSNTIASVWMAYLYTCPNNFGVMPQKILPSLRKANVIKSLELLGHFSNPLMQTVVFETDGSPSHLSCYHGQSQKNNRNSLTHRMWY